MMFYTDENLYYRGIWEMVNSNTSKVLRYCEIVLPFHRKKSVIMLILLLRQATIQRSAAETIDTDRNL
jgi:hypothetical protein